MITYQYDPSIHEVRSKLAHKIQLNSAYGKFGVSQVPLETIRHDAEEHFKRMEAIRQKMHDDFIQSNRKEFESLKWKFEVRNKNVS